jgi:hypothetical protein
MGLVVSLVSAIVLATAIIGRRRKSDATVLHAVPDTSEQPEPAVPR